MQLLTFTASHGPEDRLRSLMDAHQKAHARFWSTGQVKRLIQGSGAVGRITAQEVTWGEASGWHPHRHVLLLGSRELGVGEISTLQRRWTASAGKASLEACPERGLDVRGGEAAGAYLTKLGNELALGHAKKGRNGRYAPFDLLDLGEVLPAHGQAFVEYSEATRGRRLLWWSRGLKSRFGVEEISDEEICQRRAEEDERQLAELTKSLFRDIVAARKRGEFLAIAGASNSRTR